MLVHPVLYSHSPLSHPKPGSPTARLRSNLSTDTSLAPIHKIHRQHAIHTPATILRPPVLQHTTSIALPRSTPYSYIIPINKRSATSKSYTEVTQNLATVPPPSPSPRKKRPNSLNPLTGAQSAPPAAPLTKPRSSSHSHAKSGRDSTGDNLVSSNRSRPQQRLAIDGILINRSNPVRIARKIGFQFDGTEPVMARHENENESSRDEIVESFSSFCSVHSEIPLPLLIEDHTIYPFSLQGSIIRGAAHNPQSSGKEPTWSTRRQRQIWRYLANHAGLG